VNVTKRDGKIYVSDALGFDFEDGTLVLSPRQAYDLMAELEMLRVVIAFDDEGDGEDG
jgi:hypothetical protein